MKEVLEFLQKSKVFFLATSENNVPHVRPMGFIMECGGKLAFMTDNTMALCKQLAANPKVEITAIDENMNTLRISGTVKFATTPETQKKVLEVMPALAKSYSVGDGKLEVFYLDEGCATCSTMAGEKKELSL
ncbi:MAG: pyridoxamine 5'-phosphate oxidase family protein [Synergistaceae bacterium]|nr:pyridoxamine 5'-phosphate oxidase family protein [Synergistaceae bacterium]